MFSNTSAANAVQRAMVHGSEPLPNTLYATSTTATAIVAARSDTRWYAR